VILDAAVINRAAAPARTAARPKLNHWFFVAGVGLLVLLAWLMGRWGGFEPGSETGYNLGLAGGIMMLLLFLYPCASISASCTAWAPPSTGSPCT